MGSELGSNSERFGRRTVGRIVVYGFLLLVIVAVLLPVIPPGRRDGAGYSRTRCLTNLKMIEAGKQAWAIQKNATNGTVVKLDDLMRGEIKYLPSLPQCPSGGTYSFGVVGLEPSCSQGHSLK